MHAHASVTPDSELASEFAALQIDGVELVLPLRTDEDVVSLRKVARDMLVSMRFSVLDQTKIITAASELARNTLRYGRGGECQVVTVIDASRTGIALTFIDQGPGIADIALALTDGYTTGGGMGLGLSGSKRLVDLFELITSPERGTTVKIVKWKPY